MFVLLVIVFGFVLGILTVLGVEALGVAFLIQWLNKKIEKNERIANSESLDDFASVTDLHQSELKFKQGIVWILESTKVPKGRPFDKGANDQKPKNEILEVTPVRKRAKIMDSFLILAEPDGSQAKIPLRGCKIEAVSASGFPSRKWTRRYPIKVEGKESEIYQGCKIVYVYLETSWEKESWCKALRLASCDDKEKLSWVTKLSTEFHHYGNSLNSEYPSFIKPLNGITADPVDMSLRIDGSSGKVRQFLKRLAKKSSRSNIEYKSSNPTSSGEESKKTSRSHSFSDSAFPAGWERLSAAKHNTLDGSKSVSSSSSSVTPGNEIPSSTVYDKDPDEKIFPDEGTLCWNLLISRLFFDAKNNKEMKTALQSRIQRMLSNMRSPSYIGDITCTSADTGNVPPHIHAMRVLPSNMNEVWAFEIDIEYAGGAVLGVETRLEVGKLDAQDKGESKTESSSVGEVPSELLEEIQYFGKQLNVSEEAALDREPEKERDRKPDDSRSSKVVARASAQVSRWKSMLNSVAKQVSQVPLALGVKVASLRGTVRLYIKPPPSDQIWFGFTFMPEVEFSLESFVGDHKVTSGHLALYLISRFKAAIRETLVLPNCESVYIPWMLAEKDDWVPRKVAPFMWIHQDSAADATAKQEGPGSRLANVVYEAVSNTTTQEAQDSQQGNGLRKKLSQVAEAPNDPQDVKLDEAVKVGIGAHKKSESSESCSSTAPIHHSTSNDHLPVDSSQSTSNDHLPADLLDSGEKSLERNPSLSSRGSVESCVTSQAMTFYDGSSQSVENDDMRPPRVGTKARMLGFRKKMGEKLEEKRRHIGEKGKTIVEKIRESKQNN